MRTLVFLLLLLPSIPAFSQEAKSTLSTKNESNDIIDEELLERAKALSRECLILDSHIDWPYMQLLFQQDISERVEFGDFDLVRAREGGLDAVLSVAYIEPGTAVEEGRLLVDSLITLATRYAEIHPDEFALASTPGEVKENFSNNLLSIPLCLENGSPIGNDLEYLRYLKEMGIAYITLTHSRVNQISDSNFDPERKWNGLSPFGVEVISEMNRLGIMIDISHSTDSVVVQSLRYSRAPIIASHSSCRHFIPGLERNLSDDLIRAIADKDGVVLVNLGSFFLDPVCSRHWSYLYDTWQDSTGISIYSAEGAAFILEYGKTHKLRADSKAAVDHIEHIIRIAGIDHVGIGSDYDGIFMAQPTDLPDVSGYPVIIYELLKRGYSDEEIQKIMSGNFLRAWKEVIEVGNMLSTRGWRLAVGG